MVITFFEGDFPNELNTSIYRCRIPAARLREAGHRCHTYHAAQIADGQITPEMQSNIEESEVIVIERFLIKEVHQFIENMRSSKKVVLATFDDNYTLIPDSPSRNTWRGGKKARGGKGAILNEFRSGLRLCSGYMTPSKLLCDDFRPFNSHAYYVPNFLDASLYQNPPAKNPDVFIVGYGGTSLHNISLKDSHVIPALGRLSAEYPRFQVHLQPAFLDVIEAFKKNGVRFTVRNWQPFQDWPKTVSLFNVGIIPLSGEYDRRRSSLHAQELGMAGVPWVATDENPYYEARGGIRVKNHHNDWYRAIRSLMIDKELYRKLSEDGKEWSTDLNATCVDTYLKVFGE